MLKKFDFDAPKSLTEIVAGRVRQAIVDGELHLGQNISEEALAESFGVSRTPVRDALMLLQTAGLVEIRPKRGSFVFLPSEADIQAICDFRAVLELHAAKLSHAVAKEATLERLDALIAQMAEADRLDDAERYGRVDTMFHEALFENCGNTYVRDAYGLMSGKIAAMRTNLSKQFSNARTVSMQEHRDFVRMFGAGDFAVMATLLEEHIGRTVEAFRRGAEGNAAWRAAKGARLPGAVPRKSRSASED